MYLRDLRLSLPNAAILAFDPALRAEPVARRLHPLLGQSYWEGATMLSYGNSACRIEPEADSVNTTCLPSGHTATLVTVLPSIGLFR